VTARFRHLAPWLVLLAAAGAPARAVESRVPTEARALAQFLGSPARPDRAWRAWEHVRSREVELAVRLADALGIAGGHGALGPLGELLRDRDPRVRLAATAAVGRVGLRSEDVAERLRDVLRWREDDELLGAVEALGRLGDGRDVEPLIDLMAAEDRRVGLAAYAALAQLSGRSIPPVPSRWSYWWRTARLRSQAQVRDAVTAIEEEPEGPFADLHVARLREAAWVELPGVRALLREWITGSNDALQSHAIGLALDLALAELGPRIERLREMERDGTPLALQADEALVRLGLRLPPLPEPTPAEPVPTLPVLQTALGSGDRVSMAWVSAPAAAQDPRGIGGLLAAWLEGVLQGAATTR
jgi:hypothetical protein